MAVQFLSKPFNDHPITKIQYELVTSNVDVGGMSFRLTTLSDVEKGIDCVFDWLAMDGRSDAEIEKLAPYFGVVWPSSLALCGFLLQKKWSQFIRGKSLLELGCGLALPSMVAARLGAHVLATDFHPDVPRFLEQNIIQNEPCDLRFADGAVIPSKSEGFDFVIASDVLYESPMVENFAAMITSKAHPQSIAVVSDPGRPYIQAFVRNMDNLGWNYELQPWSVQWGGKANDIYLLIFRRK